MPARPPIPNGRWRTAALAVGVATALVMTPIDAAAATATGAEQRLLELINGARTSRGLQPLALRDDLVRVARRHSLRMARERLLFHRPCLSCRLPPSSAVAENVGMGTSLRRIHRAMVRSAGHRHNLLGGFDAVGVGVVMRGGRYWVTEIFLR